MSHTPGPWRYTKVGGQSRDFQIVSVGSGGFIAQASHEPYARLIAAAPDLLAALRPMVDGTYWINDEQVKAARAAIAKAEGK